ncbi:MAG: alpha/beta hydrolase [Rhodospirillales bacterium]|nr:alpha/beta hydrolase [Rhodospirillales bacterium]
MAGWLVTGLVVYGGLLAGLYVFQRQLLYHPSATVPDRARAGVADMRAVALRTEDGLDLLAWYKPPAAPGGRLVILFHGNAGNIGHRAHKARRFLDAGFGVLLVSWRGFAGNAGAPSEEGLMRDARAAMAFARAEGFTPGRIAFYGESLGSGLAVAMAAEAADAGTPVAGVVLEAPYTTIPAVAQHHYFYVPATLLVHDKFDSLSRIARIKTPLLVVHGVRDRTVPVRFGEMLFAAAREPKQALWLSEAAHNNVYEFGAGERVVAFLKGM